MNPWTPPEGSGVVAPPDVRTACQLWWGVIALGAVRLIAGAVDRYRGRHDLARQMYDQVHAQQPQTTLAQVQLVVVVLLVVIVAFGLGLAVGAVVIVHQLRLGKAWARLLLDIVTAILVVGAIDTMVGLGAVSGVAQLITGASAILQAVLAAGALFLCHRSDSTEFFRLHSRRDIR